MSLRQVLPLDEKPGCRGRSRARRLVAAAHCITMAEHNSVAGANNGLRVDSERPSRCAARSSSSRCRPVSSSCRYSFRVLRTAVAPLTPVTGFGEIGLKKLSSLSNLADRREVIQRSPRSSVSLRVHLPIVLEIGRDGPETCTELLQALGESAEEDRSVRPGGSRMPDPCQALDRVCVGCALWVDLCVCVTRGKRQWRGTRCR